jgi:hypothetical protein
MIALRSVVPAAAIFAVPVGETDAGTGQNGQKHGDKVSNIHPMAPFLSRATRHAR